MLIAIFELKLGQWVKEGRKRGEGGKGKGERNFPRPI